MPQPSFGIPLYRPLEKRSTNDPKSGVTHTAYSGLTHTAYGGLSHTTSGVVGEVIKRSPFQHYNPLLFRAYRLFLARNQNSVLSLM